MSKASLTGEELFEFYTSQEGEYRQTLFTAHMQIGDELFKLLEQAEMEGKKIVLQDEMNDTDDAPFSVILE